MTPRKIHKPSWLVRDSATVLGGGCVVEECICYLRCVGRGRGVPAAIVGTR
jgi:hypothetical protein